MGFLPPLFSSSLPGLEICLEFSFLNENTLSPSFCLWLFLNYCTNKAKNPKKVFQFLGYSITALLGFPKISSNSALLSFNPSSIVRKNKPIPLFRRLQTTSKKTIETSLSGNSRRALDRPLCHVGRLSTACAVPLPRPTGTSCFDRSPVQNVWQVCTF